MPNVKLGRFEGGRAPLAYYKGKTYTGGSFGAAVSLTPRCTRARDLLSPPPDDEINLIAPLEMQKYHLEWHSGYVNGIRMFMKAVDSKFLRQEMREEVFSLQRVIYFTRTSL